MASIRTVQKSSSDAPEEYFLRRRITTVGSASDSDIQLLGDNIFGHHATITCEGPHFVVRPAAKKATLKINGKKCRRKKVLEHDDELTVGDAELRFRILDDRSPAQVAKPQVHRRLEGLERIHQLSIELLQANELDELLDELIDSAIALTGADKGFLVLTDGDDWSIRVARNVDLEAIIDDSSHLSDSVLQEVMRVQKPIIIADARTDEQFRDAQSVIDLELCSVMCVPLLDRGQLLGVIYVGNDRVADLFDELHLDLLSIFAAKLSLVIANAILMDELRSDNRSLKNRLRSRRFGSLIGASDAMKPVFHAIDRVAPTNVTVLITGETGTGKELVAAELHRRSDRADGPFVTLNCGAIPENLLESELFGHVEGAFTGASQKRNGKFHAADGGTLFLDEVGEMPPNLQVKLLRVLQERTFTRVGSNTAESVDIRILAATNRNLADDVSSGNFREDLYYRLHVVEITLPALRERENDIILIAEYLIDQISDELQISPRKLSADATRAMRKFDWPGNVRQLENRLKKALVLAQGSTLSAEDLDLSPALLPEPTSLAEAKEKFALKYVLQVLEKNDGNRSQTARDLDIDPRTVFRYLEKSSSPADG